MSNNNSGSVVVLAMIAIAACVMFACAGAWATLTLGDTAANAELALAAAMGDDTAQTGRAVCVAGIANFGSCNVSQTQTRTETETQAPDGETMDWLFWSATAIIGLAVICFVGVLASALEMRQ